MSRATALSRSSPAARRPTPAARAALCHLCLLTGDLHATVEQLRQADIAIDREPKVSMDGNWQAWIHDPDGNAIELMQLSEDSCAA